MPYRRLTVATSAEVRAALLRAARQTGTTVSALVTDHLRRYIRGRLRVAPPYPTATTWHKTELFLPAGLLRDVRQRLRRDRKSLASLLAVIAREADRELPVPGPRRPVTDPFLDHVRNRGWTVTASLSNEPLWRLSSDNLKLHLYIADHGTPCDAVNELVSHGPRSAIAAVEAAAWPYAVMLSSSWSRRVMVVSSVFPTPSQVSKLLELSNEHTAAPAPSDDLPFVLPEARAWLPDLAPDDPRTRFLREAWTWIAPADRTPDAAERLAEIVGQFPPIFVAEALEHHNDELRLRVRRAASSSAWRDLVRLIDHAAKYHPSRRRCTDQ
jgi:hypothetical protein